MRQALGDLMKLFLYGGPRLPLGFRLGVGFDPMRYLRSLGVPRLSLTPTSQEGAFLYVISDGQGNCKVGVSQNPLQRIRDLQSGHPERLELAWVALTPGSGYNIEALVKRTTELLRAPGGDEWRRMSPAQMINTIAQTAMFLGEPIRSIPPDQVGLAAEELANWRPALEGAPPPLPQPIPVYYHSPFTFVAWTAIVMSLIFAVFFFLLGNGRGPRPALQGDLGNFSQNVVDFIPLVREGPRQEGPGRLPG